MEALAQWVQAIASAMTLVAAVWAGLIARKVYEIESRRDGAAARGRKRSGAARVNAWTATSVRHSTAEDIEMRRSVGLVLVNAGLTPVYDVHLTSTDRHGEPADELRQHVLPPGEYFVEESAALSGWASPDDVRYLDARVRPVTQKENWRVTSLSFSDAEGVRWHRDAKGRLTEVMPTRGDPQPEPAVTSRSPLSSDVPVPSDAPAEQVEARTAP